MTNERIAIEALGRIHWPPGSWTKRFVRSLNARKEGDVLTVKQRQTLWKIAWKYHQRMPQMVKEESFDRQNESPERTVFEDTLDSTPDDATTRLIFADWLDEHDIPHAQRFMVKHEAYPHLVACGVGYEPSGNTPINFEWTFGMRIYKMFGHMIADSDYLPYHHKSRRAAEAALLKAIQGQEQYAIPEHPAETVL